MAGHSKWKSIKHKKGAADAKRGKLFAKLGKEIYVASKNGDPNPDNNAALRLAIEKARTQSMPKENIDRAIQRGQGSSEGEKFEEIMYEGYGPGGSAFLVFCLSDNHNRVAAFVKSTFSRSGGKLGSDGTVSYMFNRLGYILIEKKNLQCDIEEFELSLMNLEIIDILEVEDIIEIKVEPQNFLQIKEYIDEKNYVSEYLKAEVTMIPNIEVELDEEKIEKVENLVDILEENDDIQEVFTNIKHV